MFYKAADADDEETFEPCKDFLAEKLGTILFPHHRLAAPSTLCILSNVAMVPRHNLKGSLRRAKQLNRAVQEQHYALSPSNSPVANKGATSPFLRRDFLNAHPELQDDIVASKRLVRYRKSSTSAHPPNVGMDLDDACH